MRPICTFTVSPSIDILEWDDFIQKLGACRPLFEKQITFTKDTVTKDTECVYLTCEFDTYNPTKLRPVFRKTAYDTDTIVPTIFDIPPDNIQHFFTNVSLANDSNTIRYDEQIHGFVYGE